MRKILPRSALVCLLALLLPIGAAVDAIIRTQAMFASTIAEFSIEEGRIAATRSPRSITSSGTLSAKSPSPYWNRASLARITASATGVTPS